MSDTYLGGPARPRSDEIAFDDGVGGRVAVSATNPLPVTGGGGGGGGGDASAANQATQITAEQATATAVISIDSKMPASPATTAKQDTGNTSLASITTNTGRLPAQGTALSAASLPIVTATDDVIQGALTETAPATDTASSGHNGRLQRIAQRLTSLIALFTSTAAADANRLPISEPDSLVLTPASLTATGTLFTQDMTGYRAISVSVTSPGTTCTITYETSDDNATWFGTGGLTAAAVGGSLQVTTSTGSICLQFPRRGRYFRARVSTYTSGAVTVVATLSTAATPDFGSYKAVGGVGGHGSVILANPVRIGGRALTANYTAVTTGQTADFASTLVGAQIIKPFSIPEADWNYAAATGGISNSTTAVTIAAAAGAGLRNYITGIQISSDTLGAATEVAVRDGASGTVLWRAKLTTAGISGGDTFIFSSPLKSTANTLLEVVTLTASVTGGVYFNAQGYIAP